VGLSGELFPERRFLFSDLCMVFSCPVYYGDDLTAEVSSVVHHASEDRTSWLDEYLLNLSRSAAKSHKSIKQTLLFKAFRSILVVA
jgi:hypothetical protein